MRPECRMSDLPMERHGCHISGDSGLWIPGCVLVQCLISLMLYLLGGYDKYLAENLKPVSAYLGIIHC